MFTKYAVIQKISTNGIVTVYQAEKENMHWEFEYRRSLNTQDNADIFPFRIDSTIPLITRKSSPETVCYKLTSGEIIFKDDYEVPEGFIICIISPENYYPSMIKFRESTNIPIAYTQFSRENPGFVKLYSNRFTMQSAVTLFTTSTTSFGLNIDFVPCYELFPSNNEISSYDPFELSLKIQQGEKKYITQEDIRSYCTNISDNTSVELIEVINKLVDYLRNTNAKNSELVSIKNRLSVIFTNIISTGSGIVTIADSVVNQGFAYNILKLMFSFFGK